MAHALLWLVLLGCWALVHASQGGTSTASVSDQLRRMSEAMRTQSFEGTVVYVHGERVETLRIVHRIQPGQTIDSVTALNGPVRIITGDERQLTCVMERPQAALMEHHGAVSEVLRSQVPETAVLEQHYVVHALGGSRVAGRPTEVIGVSPRDNLRYGYRFYLDVETGLPLKVDLMGEGADPIEQVLFTALELGPRLPVPPEPSAQPAVTAPPGAPSSAWRFVNLPPGFTVVHHRRLELPEAGTREHFVLSDGLAAVSVYIEQSDQAGLIGSARIGAVNAEGGRVAGHHVTVVGEVPAITVRQVLASVDRVPGGAAR